MKKKIFIVLGLAVVAVIVIFMATGVLKFNVGPTQKQEFVLPEGWTKYTSGEFGFSVAYPEDWNFKENNNGGSREMMFVSPGGKAFVRVAAFIDDSLKTPEAVEASMAQYKATLEAKDENEEVLKQFKSEMNNQMGGFMASGMMASNGSAYQYLERGLLATNGRVLIMRGGVDTSETKLTQAEFDSLVAAVKKIMDSFGVK
jgi:hypothetical protein